MIPIFKTKRIEREFRVEIDGRLRAVYLEAAEWLWKRHKVQLVLTSLNRTEEENDAIGGSEYSAHLKGRAGDSRTRGWDDNILEDFMEHLQKTWGGFLYVLYHHVTTGPHLHINIRYKYRRMT